MKLYFFTTTNALVYWLLSRVTQPFPGLVQGLAVFAWFLLLALVCRYLTDRATNSKLNEDAATRCLGHWECVSLRNNHWWRRKDGRETTYCPGHYQSIWIQLQTIDEEEPMK